MNNKYFQFHINLMGYTLYKNNMQIPLYIAFWSGYNSDEILTGKSDIKALDKL